MYKVLLVARGTGSAARVRDGTPPVFVLLHSHRKVPHRSFGAVRDDISSGFCGARRHPAVLLQKVL
jgi:hypothetical protein